METEVHWTERVGGRLLVAGLLAAVPVATFAEDVEKKWRLGAAIGGYNPVDQIDSDAPNSLGLVNSDGSLEQLFLDPRNDRGAFGDLDVQDGLTGTVLAQYALTPTFLVEGSIGYMESDVGDVEMQAQFQEPLDDLLEYEFTNFRIPVGVLTRIPIQVTGMWRFRPRARFNPYFGAGLGYAFLGLELDDRCGDNPSPSCVDFQQLSKRLDQSLGRATRISSTFPIGSSATEIGPLIDLSGATVSARDSFEWHAVTGAEFSIRRKWHVYADLRWVSASHTINIGFNGEDDLGVKVPQTVDFIDSELATIDYGPVSISQGGLVDAGSITQVPKATFLAQNPTLTCISPPGEAQNSPNPQCQVFVRVPDGNTDAGLYYIQGGRINYDGFHLQIGFRYTFD